MPTVAEDHLQAIRNDSYTGPSVVVEQGDHSRRPPAATKPEGGMVLVTPADNGWSVASFRPKELTLVRRVTTRSRPGASISERGEVCAAGVLGSAVTLLRRQHTVRVDLVQETVRGGLTCRRGARRPVFGVCPRAVCSETGTQGALRRGHVIHDPSAPRHVLRPTVQPRNAKWSPQLPCIPFRSVRRDATCGRRRARVHRRRTRRNGGASARTSSP